MKIKSLFTFALAATMLFSCSKEENDGPGINPEEGVETFVKVSLNRLANNTKAHYGDLDATAEEEAINSVRLYVFNSVGVLEAEVPFDAASESKTFKATTGKKTFLAAVNIPTTELPSVTPGTTTLASIKNHASATAITNMNQLADTATPNFWMTTLNDDNTFVLEEADETETTGSSPKNNVLIKVGRAMAKVGVYFDEANVQPADGKLSDVMYKIMNNPNKMQIFTSNDGSGYRITPYYDGLVTGTYFDNADYLETGLSMQTPIGGGTQRNMHKFPSYMMENSNLEPKGSNATYVMIKGVFTPKTVFNADGTTSRAGVEGDDFWRIHDGTGYESKYYYELPTGLTSPKVAVKYDDGESFYTLPLADINQSNTVDRYTIKRNTYWSVSIISVNGAGDNTENGAKPDPDENLEADTYMKAIITVEQWEDVEQGGGI